MTVIGKEYYSELRKRAYTLSLVIHSRQVRASVRGEDVKMSDDMAAEVSLVLRQLSGFRGTASDEPRKEDGNNG